MDIIFRTDKLGKLCSSRVSAIRKWGDVRGELIMRRLQEMVAANNLSQLVKLPQAHCHPLKENRKGQWAVSVLDPYRLIFEPANNPIQFDQAGQLLVEQVTAVRILEVINYHD